MVAVLEEILKVIHSSRGELLFLCLGMVVSLFLWERYKRVKENEVG